VQTTSPTTTNDLDDEEINRMDTIDLRPIVEDRDINNVFLAIDQSTTKQDDENTNDKIEHGLTQVSCSSSDDELDTNKTKLFHQNTKSVPLTNDQQPQNNGEDEQHSTTNLSTDNDNTPKR
jgi:hypothetical protein